MKFDIKKTKESVKTQWNGFVDWVHWVKPRHLPYYLTCEPNAFFLYIGTYFMVTLQPQLLNQRMTEDYGGEAADNETRTDYENRVQTQVIMWTMWRFGANVVFAIVMITFLGAWSDRVGRKFNLMLGSAALGINIMSNVYIFSSSAHWPLFTYIILGAMEGAFGNYGGCYYAAQAYISDLVTREELSFRLNIVSMFRGAGATVGSLLAGLWADSIGLVEFMVIGNAVLLIPFTWAFFWIPMIPPAVFERAKKQYAIDQVGERERVNTVLNADRRLTRAATMRSFATDGKDSDRKMTVLAIQREPANDNKFVEIMKQLGQQYVMAFQTFTKKRVGYRRLCIWLLTLCGFISTLAGVEAGQLVGIYTSFEPLYWKNKDLAKWQTHGLLCGMFGQLFGVILFKKILKLRDTTILVITFILFGASNIPIAFPTDLNMYISNYIGCTANIINPCLASLMTNFVDPDEIGRCLIAFGVTMYLAVFAQNFVLQYIYLWSISINFRGLMLLFVAILNLLCVIPVIFIHMVTKPEEIVYKVDDIVEEEMKNVELEETLSVMDENKLSVNGN
jgi:MFS family permease